MNMKIKSCPFCGARATLVEEKYCLGDYLIFAVKCSRCHAESGHYKDANAAIVLWNIRQ